MTRGRLSSAPSDIVAGNVRQLRHNLGMNREQFAAKCASVGASHITLAALVNIETGRPDINGERRRKVTVDELCAFGAALNVDPMLLLQRELTITVVVE